jgi:hypothetical protein
MVSSKKQNEYKGECLPLIFCTVLETYIHVQNLGLLDNITLTLGGQQCIVNLHIHLAFSFGDMQDGD